MKIRNIVREQQENVHIEIGDYEMIIEKRYRVVSLINDLLLGVLYFIGSILFLTDVSQAVSISFFLAGSIMMIIRAGLNILKDLHVNKITGTKRQ
ncbi:YrhK-like protein [Cytobacillus firmus]|uniref:YrhK-like protein n=2 Tax=Cytobacillus TaxID=2675230 RepID=A0A366K3P3_CYTFI|nr:MULTISPECIES: YrhK family protein [Cytobacillus]RBP95942.1 YrhK-like protein [Cytobacillus firmus]TDX44855.1 YrhK-like protein [Cytobacillus oceanisediminis]